MIIPPLPPFSRRVKNYVKALKNPERDSPGEERASRNNIIEAFCQLLDGKSMRDKEAKK